MLTDEQLADSLSQALHDRTATLFPQPDLADQVIRRRRATRRRTQIGATAASSLVIATAAVALGIFSSGHSIRIGASELHLAGYAFKLPRGVQATPAACAIGAAVDYIPGPGEGASSAGQPAIAHAVTVNGGCVSMLLSDPYTPGAANAPSEPFDTIDQHSVEIGSYTGTVGTYAVIGSGITFNGTPVPSGTRHVVLSVDLPASGDEVRELQVAVAGISEQQLVSLVTSGLQTTMTSSTSASVTP